MTKRVGALAVIAAIVVVLLVLVVLSWPALRELRSPEPVAAWVAVEVGGAGVARTGMVEIEAGRDFRLHAVLEARDDDGDSVYYTDATALEIGGQPVPEGRLLRWNRRQEARILWFTVEGPAPFVRFGDEEGLANFAFEELFRPEWPRAWAIPGVLEPRFDDHLRRDVVEPDPPFGTQRYHARVELFDAATPLVPTARFKSWGAEQVEERGAEFTGVIARLPPPLATASAVFGLTQLEPGPELAAGSLGRLDTLVRGHFAFTREAVFAATLPNGIDLATLDWRQVHLDGGLRWGGEVSPGDLIRVEERVVLLFEDATGDGGLDGSDLCLDFSRGAVVNALDTVFSGPGFVELAHRPDS